MSENQPLTRAQLREKWAKEAAQQPLTRREIRRREREEEARLQAIATGELSLTQQQIADAEIPAELTPPRPPHEDGRGEPARRSLRKELSERLDESGTRRGRRGIGEPDASREDEQQSAKAPKPASLPKPPAATAAQSDAARASRRAGLTASAQRSVNEARYAQILTGEIPAVSEADTPEDALPAGDDSVHDDPQPRKPRRRPVAPPTTAQGVRVMDQATGELKTITPENYPVAMSQEHSSLQAKIDAALPTDEAPAVSETNQASETEDASPAGEPGVPKRVSLLGDTARSDDTPASRREIHREDGPTTQKSEPQLATWLKVLLAVIAVSVLCVLVWIVANKVPKDADTGAAQPTIITTTIEEPSA